MQPSVNDRLCLAVVIIGLLVAPLAIGAASSGDDSIGINERGIAARINDAGELVVVFDVDESRMLPWRGHIWIEVLDMQDQVAAAGNTGKTFFVDDKLAVSLPLGKIDRSRPSAYVIHYVFAGAGVRSEGSRSLAAALGAIQTTVYGQTELLAGAPAGVRVAVREHYSGEPVADAGLDVDLVKDGRQVSLFRGRTDHAGTADIEFRLPADVDGGAMLRIKVESSRGDDLVEQAVTVKRESKVLVVTDKPLYQPGQTIHIRALTLSEPDHKPLAGRPYVIEVEDSKGNKVFKSEGKLDQFGLAFCRFVLGTELNLGTYRIRVKIDDDQVEKTVTVDRYVLPKFKAAITTERDFYLPGETMKGKIQADYFFGKPVSGGEVKIIASTQDVGLSTFAVVDGKTDGNGSFEFELRVPDSLVGQPLLDGKAAVVLEVQVRDTAQHEQTTSLTVPVAAEPLVLAAIPESGDPVPGVENRIFIIASTPDGQPAKVRFENPFNKGSFVNTDDLGLAVISTVPKAQALSFTIEASDSTGRRASREFAFNPADTSEHILLRPGRAVYKVGDTVNLAAYTDHVGAGWVYFDVIRGKQTVLTKTGDIINGRSELVVPLGNDLTGALTFSAYIITPQGQVVRDTRLAFVGPADDLRVSINPDKDVYLPGEHARLLFTVKSADGRPTVAALGVNIVDESVFALQEMQPGLERVFFMLESEIMKPRYEFHEYSLQGIVKPESQIDPRALRERDRAYEVLLASSEEVVSYSLSVDTFASRNQGDGEVQTRVYNDYQRIYDACQAYYQKHKEYPPLKNGAELFVSERFIDSKYLRDPWGTEYKIESINSSDVMDFFQITSAGPDEAFNTSDDISAGNYGWGFAEGDVGADFLMFEEMDGAGGGAPLVRAAAPGAGKAADEDRAMRNGGTRSTSTGEETSGSAEPRIRKFFPETLLSEPALITDPSGSAALEFDLADSITTWRATALANNADGLLGSATSPIRVFQEFFVDIDFPVALTQNDTVHVPVAVYNYLDRQQTVRLKAEPGDWFELIDGRPEKSIELQAGQVSVAYFPITVRGIGSHSFTVKAYGSTLSDAVQREVEVAPDGKMFEDAVNGRLEGTISQKIHIPSESIDDASKIFIKFHPGVMSQMVEGLEGMLQMPSGCFEQTSSATYPNIMVMQYLKATGQINPEVAMKAEGYINNGYQRLLSFEVKGGGFEWFGEEPAHVILTAYGLMEFYDMSKVFNVDPNVISRTQQWLASKQKQDGSWEPNKHYLDAVAAAFGTDVIRNTAYVTWALLYTGDNGAAAKQGLAYLEKHLDEIKDSYTLALAANALVLGDPKGKAAQTALERLRGSAEVKGDTAYWPQEGATSTYAYGDSADVETTALAVQALLVAGVHQGLVEKAINYLIEKKDANGTWYSTQATVYSLKALVMASQGASSDTNAEVVIKVDGKVASSFAITPKDADVMRLIDLKELTREGDNNITVEIQGQGSILYSIVSRYFIPWNLLPEEAEPMSITVNYDKTRLATDDLVTCQVTVKSNVKGDFGMVIADLGIPPGFEVQAEDLAGLVGSGAISKFDMTGRQVIVYLDEVKQGEPIKFSYRLKAKYPVRAQTPKSRVYQYYDPAAQAFAQPIQIEVGQ